MARRRRRRRGVLVVLLMLGVAGAAAAVVGPDLLHRYGDRFLASSKCTVTLSGATSTLTAQQADNAEIIAATALRKGLPNHAVTVALATAIQESDLRNLDYGDRDSVGLFQQRPSQGWGTVEQIRDPRFAATQFYDHLQHVDGWEAMPVTDAAQAVQRSGHPLGYADHEADARLWARVLTGESAPQALSCSLPGAKPAVGAAQGLADRAALDLADRVAVSIDPPAGSVTTIRLTAKDPVMVNAAASWAIAVATGWPIQEVSTCDARWTRAGGTWAATDGAAQGCSGAVVVTLATG